MTEAQDRFVEDLLKSPAPPLELAQRHGVDLATLTQWLEEGEVQRRLAFLKQLGDIQAQLTLSQYRCYAASNLMKLATQEGGAPEPTRRACIDALTLEVPGAQLSDGDDGEIPLATLRCD